MLGSAALRKANNTFHGKDSAFWFSARMIPAVRSSTTSFRTWTVIDRTVALVERPVHHATDAKHRCPWVFFGHAMPRKSQLVASEVMGKQRQHVAWTLFASAGQWKHLVNGLSRWHLRLTYFMGPEKLDASRKQRQSRCEWLENWWHQKIIFLNFKRTLGRYHVQKMKPMSGRSGVETTASQSVSPNTTRKHVEVGVFEGSTII